MKKLFLSLLLLSSTLKAYAGILDVQATGLAFHPSRLSESFLRANPMPRKLDKQAVWVITPGFVVGYDFRTPNKKKGKSTYAVFSHFRDCYDWPFTLIGGGRRYRFNISKRCTFDFNVVGVLISTKTKVCPIQWKGLDLACVYRIPNTHTRLVLAPYISVGLQYHFLNNVALGIGCVPLPWAPQMAISFSCTFPKSNGGVEDSR